MAARRCRVCGLQAAATAAPGSGAGVTVRSRHDCRDGANFRRQERRRPTPSVTNLVTDGEKRRHAWPAHGTCEPTGGAESRDTRPRLMARSASSPLVCAAGVQAARLRLSRSGRNFARKLTEDRDGHATVTRPADRGIRFNLLSYGGGSRPGGRLRVRLRHSSSRPQGCGLCHVRWSQLARSRPVFHSGRG